MALKISDYEIEIDKVVPAVPEKTEKVRYNYKDLLAQRDSITKQRDDMIALKQKELDEVNAIIAECESAGISIVK